MPRLDTLSYYGRTEPRGDDWMYFQIVENKRGRLGHHIDASKLGTSLTALKYLDFVSGPGYLGAWRVIEEERAAVVRNGRYRVILSGIGGDEFFGGIPDPCAHLADLIVQFKLIALAKQLMAWSLAKRKPWIQILWLALVDLLPPSLGQYFAKKAEVETWIRKDFAKRTRIAIPTVGPKARGDSSDWREETRKGSRWPRRLSPRRLLRRAGCSRSRRTPRTKY